jgi:hypothetical protein
MYLNAWEGHYDLNMYHILTSVIKFAVFGGSTYVIFSICNLYCVLNIIKEITRIRVRSGRDHIFCRNLNRIGLMGGIRGNINFTKQSYSNRIRGHGSVLEFLWIRSRNNQHHAHICTQLGSTTYRPTTLRHTGHLTTLYDVSPNRSVFSCNSDGSRSSLMMADFCRNM